LCIRILRGARVEYIITLAGICTAAFALSIFVTLFLLRRFDRFGLVDIPNERSAHFSPTPRGGGLSFIFSFIIGSAGLFLSGLVSQEWLLPVLAAGPMIAIVGIMDDRRSMSATSRLLTHFSAAFLVYLLVTKGFEVNLNVSFVPADWPFVTFVFCLLFVSWMVNLYNFMDGIDGMAATNAVVCAVCLAGLSFWQSHIELTSIYLLLAATVLGFLVFNWAPAKIFMGDSGSTFLGFVFATLALTGKGLTNVPFVANVIVLGCFIVDATYTLLVRGFRGKRIHQAHRDHAFQHAIQIGWSHRRTVVFYSCITIFWLLPMAVGALVYDRLALVFLAIAYTPLIGLQIYFKAGIEGRVPIIRPVTGVYRNEKPTEDHGPFVH